MNNILHKQWREDIFELLSIPSFNSNGINDCADYLYNQLNKIGLDVFIETEFGTPTIIARTKNQAKKNILFYSHFDVKPTGDCSLWVTSPFEPTIKDERIYCRGSGDAKGQVFALLKGIEKLINNNRLCSDLGISLILDGGEESGSVGLSKVCEKHAEFLNCNLIVILDSHWVQDNPLLGFGCRGQISFLTTFEESEFTNDLHAGNYGGIVEGAASKMIKAINDFCKHDFINDNFYRNSDNSKIFKPAISICGINSGLIDRSIIPHKSICHIDMRLIDHDINKINSFIVEFFENKGFKVDIRQQYSSFISKKDNAQIEALQSVIKNVCNKEPLNIDYIGAYLPMEQLNALDVPIYVIPLAQHDENNHSPNENIKIKHILYGKDIIYNIFIEILKICRY